MLKKLTKGITGIIVLMVLLSLLSNEDTNWYCKNVYAAETKVVHSKNDVDKEKDPKGSISDNDTGNQKCVCDDLCNQYEFNKDCPVCSKNYKECEYKKPSVKITIQSPMGWQTDQAKVNVKAEDISDSGNFKIAKIEAKIGQNGTWIDITDDGYIEISENCNIYVRVTDHKGKLYEKNRLIKCFDTYKPSLNAAINNGVLTIQAMDRESGISAVYVNGYKYTELDDGLLTIRLEKFDASYENFIIYAKDHAGNVSDNYKTKNPYYKDPTDTTSEDPAAQLPATAKPTKPTDAKAVVTEHVKTDSNGNIKEENSLEAQKKKALAEADASEGASTGKEFYTIQTASEKTFYLIIDRNEQTEMVYFLTEVSENDLLNTTTDHSETLPKNSAAIDNGITVEETALPNNNVEEIEEVTPEKEEPIEEESSTEELEEEELPKETTVWGYMAMAALVMGIVGIAYYMKHIRKKEDFIDEEDEEDEEEFYDEEQENNKNSDDSFFDSNQDPSIEDAEEDVADTIDEETE